MKKQEFTMKLYAIYNKKNHSPAIERMWYGDEGDYYRGTGFPDAISCTPVMGPGIDLSREFEVSGTADFAAETVYVVNDVKYKERQELLQYGDGEFIPGVHHTVPKIRVAAIFTNEAEARATNPGADVLKYKILEQTMPGAKTGASVFSEILLKILKPDV
jgi:hypothetical protein